jgi:hypothetical protein
VGYDGIVDWGTGKVNVEYGEAEEAKVGGRLAFGCGGEGIIYWICYCMLCLCWYDCAEDSEGLHIWRGPVALDYVTRAISQPTGGAAGVQLLVAYAVCTAESGI